jgi:hypothetical protein
MKFSSIIFASFAFGLATAIPQFDSVDFNAEDEFSVNQRRNLSVELPTCGPSASPLVSLCDAPGSFATLCALIIAGATLPNELVSALSDVAATLTVFAPTDDGFGNFLDFLDIDDDQLTDLINGGTINDIIFYHVIATKACGPEDLLCNSRVPTVLGDFKKEPKIKCFETITGNFRPFILGPGNASKRAPKPEFSPDDLAVTSFCNAIVYPINNVINPFK